MCCTSHVLGMAWIASFFNILQFSRQRMKDEEIGFKKVAFGFLATGACVVFVAANSPYQMSETLIS